MLQALPKGEDFEGFVNFLKLLASPRAFFIHLNFKTQKLPHYATNDLTKIACAVSGPCHAGNTACIG